jgi:hypothetical protein
LGSSDAALSVSLKAHVKPRMRRLLSRFEAKDGKPTLFLGSSVSAHTQAAHEGERGMAPQRRYALLKGETARKRLGPPRLREALSYMDPPATSRGS